MSEQAGLRIEVTGIVQGVGFRPFVYNLAQRLNLRGWVRNTSGGVEMEVDGDRAALDTLIDSLKREAPPLARVERVNVTDRSPNGFTKFEIRASQESSGFQPISPDIATCPDCLRELFDPNDRHYRYPFVNCTHCGPRYSIIRDLPYDRPHTTMAGFAMCPDCAREYGDPADRRYHAQPVSCPHCGPRVWAVTGDQIIEDQEEALRAIRKLVASGEIVAIKGLGGFHLACDAANPNAVAELRRRKNRPDKPLAVMMADVAAVTRHCEMSGAEQAELESNRRPVVLLRKKLDSNVAEEVAPGQCTLGVMLPYTPLHHLLLERDDAVPYAWVMTSGNASNEPIIAENKEALAKLGHIARAFLLHDRPIQARIDDSVVRLELECGRLSPLRRARGYAPEPIRLAWQSSPMLAVGAELKNTFCLARDQYAFVSPHIGDLKSYETQQAYKQSIAHCEGLFRVIPELIVHDLHPDYQSTRYALERAERNGLPTLAVQHHHAHIAACMAEHGLPADARVIGFAFDGTGYGTDGAIWGGEVLAAGYKDFERTFHLDYVRMPGGDLAIREPWRMAFAWLHKIGYDWQSSFRKTEHAGKFESLRQQLETGINAPLNTSMGRLFDAVAALVGLRGEVTYEGQAAIELENRVSPCEPAAYTFEIGDGVFSAGPVIRAILADLKAGVRIGQIAARFHNGVAQLVVDLASEIRLQDGLNDVVLSGGVWQNMTLLAAARSGLETEGFRVFTHQQVPANDGGISLGQIAIAHHALNG